MLSYAFKVLQEDGYKHLGSEEFKNTADLFAAILIQGVNVQLKRGLTKEYIEKSEELSSLRGKIDVNTSLKKNSLIKKQLECIYDDYSDIHSAPQRGFRPGNRGGQTQYVQALLPGRLLFGE